MLEQTLDNIFSLWTKGKSPGGQVLVRQKGKVVFNKCYGYANLEHSIPVTGDTVFHVASVSKQFTCVCALLLHQDGKLNIDHDIRQYIPDLVSFPQQLTIRNMMNNVSGIRDQWELLNLQGIRLSDEITQEDVLSVIKRQKELNCDPLTEYRYSNSNFALVAEIIERVSGQKLNSFAAERIFGPLAMSSTCFTISTKEVVENLASSYFCNGSAYYAHPFLYGNYGATSLKTNTHDFMKWFDELKNPALLTEESYKLFIEAPTLKNGQKTGYGCGIIAGDFFKHSFLAHGGSDASYRSSILCFPQDDLDIAVFSNSAVLELSQCTTKIAAAILNIELPKAPEASPFYSPDEDEKNAAGTYYYTDASGMVIINEIYPKDGRFYLKNGMEDSPLTHTGGNRYVPGFLTDEVYIGKTPGMTFGGNPVPLVAFDESRPITAGLPGKYYSPELETIVTVYEQGQKQFLRMNRSIEYRLFPIDDQGAYILGCVFGATLRLEKGPAAEIIGFTISGSRALNVRFVRLEIFEKQ